MDWREFLHQQFFCRHDYEPANLPPGWVGEWCIKCGKLRTTKRPGLTYVIETQVRAVLPTPPKEMRDD